MDKLIRSLDLLEGSKCSTCIHRLSRVVEPLTPEDRAYYLDMLGLESSDPTELLIEQHKCLLTDEDIDGIILNCNQYDIAHRFNLIRDYRF